MNKKQIEKEDAEENARIEKAHKKVKANVSKVVADIKKLTRSLKKNE